MSDLYGSTRRPYQNVMLGFLDRQHKLIFILDICKTYEDLSTKNRSITTRGYRPYCEDYNMTKGWYRFNGDAGTAMATSCASRNYCGVSYPGWMNGSHPTVKDGIVTRTVCFDCHCYNKTQIKVVRCRNFYIYQHVSILGCKFGYCGNGKG